ncbi:hypothetical protein GF376_03500 [Candidatus Peregrinibacteria bacterium]|nr:hypothetical protein [Candidatus Peregrinibacteria bacterium]
MSRLPENPLNIRASDEKTKTGEILPEDRTLSSSRLERFLGDKQINIKDFDSTFSLDFIIGFTQGETSENGKRLNTLFQKTQRHLNRFKASNLFQEYSMDVVQARVNRLKHPPENMPDRVAQEVLLAFKYYDYLRSISKRMLYIKEAQRKERKDLMKGGETGVIEDLGDAVKEKMSDASENWDKWSSSKKILAVGAALIGGAMVMNSNSPTMQKVKDTLTSAAKIAGVGFIAYLGWELFTGESPFETAGKIGKDATRQPDFFKKAFDIPDQDAEYLMKSFVMIGDHSFMELARKYQAGKATGRIEGVKMDPKEAYVALSAFFKKYDLNRTRDKFRHVEPPVTYVEAVNIMMAEDPSVQIYDDAWTRLTRKVSNTASEAYNYAATTSPGIFLRQAYTDYIGGEPDDAKIDKIRKHFVAEVGFESDLTKAIDEKVAKSDFDAAKAFKEIVKGNARESVEYDVKYINGGDGYVYVLSEVEVKNELGDESNLEKKLEVGISKSARFLSNKFGKATEEVSREAQNYGNVFCAENGKSYNFSRYKFKQ